MFRKFVEGMKSLLGRRVNRGALTEEEADGILLAAKTAASLHLEKRHDVEKPDIAYLRGEISLEEDIYERERHGAWATVVPVDSRAARALERKGLVRSDRDGLRVVEPFAHMPLRIVKLAEGIATSKAELTLAQRCFTFLANHLHLHTPLHSRQVFMDHLQALAGREAATVFSNTPSIFNPFEFESAAQNYSQSFVEKIRDTTVVTHYVWNRPAVVAQIREHLASRGMTIEDLKMRYYYYFLSAGGNNPNLRVYCGDNSAFGLSGSLHCLLPVEGRAPSVIPRSPCGSSLSALRRGYAADDGRKHNLDSLGSHSQRRA